jgi:hypothetical protein
MGRSRTTGRREKPKWRPERHRYLIACEGTTEVGYFHHLGERLGSLVSLKAVQRQSDPESVVKLAAEHRRKDREAARAAGDPKDVFDGVWAVMDVDTHAHLGRALVAAQRAGIHTAVSNPCFETWLIWHVQDRTAAFSTSQEAKTLWQQLCTSSHSPGRPLANTDGALDAAIKRANHLAAHRGRDVPIHQQNPASEVGALVESICQRHQITTQFV